MHSSISSFSLPACLKAVAAAAATVAMVWVVVPNHMPSDTVLPLSVEATNEFVVEQYANAYREKPVVIVGSSITTMIPHPDCVPDNVITLPLQGRSGLTGLEAILRTGTHPEVVFVEVSTLLTAVDEVLIKEVFTPFYWQLRSLIRPLQYNRNWVVLLYQTKIAESAPFNHVIEFPSKTLDQWNLEHAAQFVAGLREARNDEAIRIVTPDIISRVRALQRQGTRVIFFDPIDPRIRNQSPNKDLRAILKTELPDVPMVDAPDDTVSIYRHDGFHLDSSSGLQFFNYLMNYAGVPFTPKCQLIPSPKTNN